MQIQRLSFSYAYGFPSHLDAAFGGAAGAGESRHLRHDEAQLSLGTVANRTRTTESQPNALPHTKRVLLGFGILPVDTLTVSELEGL